MPLLKKPTAAVRTPLVETPAADSEVNTAALKALTDSELGALAGSTTLDGATAPPASETPAADETPICDKVPAGKTMQDGGEPDNVTEDMSADKPLDAGADCGTDKENDRDIVDEDDEPMPLAEDAGGARRSAPSSSPSGIDEPLATLNHAPELEPTQRMEEEGDDLALSGNDGDEEGQPPSLALTQPTPPPADKQPASGEAGGSNAADAGADEPSPADEPSVPAPAPRAPPTARRGFNAPTAKRTGFASPVAVGAAMTAVAAAAAGASGAPTTSTINDDDDDDDEQPARMRKPSKGGSAKPRMHEPKAGQADTKKKSGARKPKRNKDDTDEQEDKEAGTRASGDGNAEQPAGAEPRDDGGDGAEHRVDAEARNIDSGDGGDGEPAPPAKKRMRAFVLAATAAATNEDESGGADEYDAVAEARRAEKRARKAAKAAAKAASSGGKKSHSGKVAKPAKPVKLSAAARRAEREASGEPKKPKSAFMFFSQAQNAKAALDGSKVSITERAKAVGVAWRSLDEAGKRPYDELAAAEKAQYAIAKAAFDKDRAAGSAKTFATPSPKKPASKANGGGGSAAQAKPRQLHPTQAAGASLAAAAPTPPATEEEEDVNAWAPKETVWLSDKVYATGDAVIWFPRALAELCNEQAHTKQLQTSGLLADATRLAQRTDCEVRARVVRSEPPASGNVVTTLVLVDDDGGAEYALPYIPITECEVAQHIVHLSLHESCAGKFKEMDHISVPFAVPSSERREDGAIRGELWEGRIYDGMQPPCAHIRCPRRPLPAAAAPAARVPQHFQACAHATQSHFAASTRPSAVDNTCGAFESLSVIWYEMSASTGQWTMRGIQNDTSVSPHECMPSEKHALWVANNGGPPPPSRRIVYGKAPELTPSCVDDLDIAPKDDSLDEYARITVLRLSTLESSQPFLVPVPRSAVDYHAVVSNPVCLREMEAKRKAGKYRTLEDLTRDVEALINNAYIGNGDDTLIFHQARELNKEWTRIQADLPAPAAANAEASEAE